VTRRDTRDTGATRGSWGATQKRGAGSAPAPRMEGAPGYCLNFTGSSVLNVISVPGLIATW
jgi:hypothetical protein